MVYELRCCICCVMPDYYTPDMVGIQVDCEVLGQLIRSVICCTVCDTLTIHHLDIAHISCWMKTENSIGMVMLVAQMYTLNILDTGPQAHSIRNASSSKRPLLTSVLCAELHMALHHLMIHATIKVSEHK